MHNTPEFRDIKHKIKELDKTLNYNLIQLDGFDNNISNLTHDIFVFEDKIKDCNKKIDYWKEKKDILLNSSRLLQEQINELSNHSTKIIIFDNQEVQNEKV